MILNYRPCGGNWWAGTAKIPAGTGIDVALACVINLTFGVKHEAQNPADGS